MGMLVSCSSKETPRTVRSKTPLEGGREERREGGREGGSKGSVCRERVGSLARESQLKREEGRKGGREGAYLGLLRLSTSSSISAS